MGRGEGVARIEWTLGEEAVDLSSSSMCGPGQVADSLRPSVSSKVAKEGYGLDTLFSSVGECFCTVTERI